MMKVVVKEEMIYAAGGCWVLERTVVEDEQKVYCRYDGSSFGVSDTSLESIWDDDDAIVFAWWEINSSFDEDHYIFDEMKEHGWYDTYTDMAAAWNADPKQLLK